MNNSNDRQYTNGEITVFWKPAKCIHATTCFRELLEVYNPRKRPWVNMQGASTERIIEVTDKCPTQAIYWKYNKDLTEEERKNNLRYSSENEVNPDSIHKQQQQPHTNEQTDSVAQIRVMPNGPLLIEGDFSLTEEGKKIKPMVITSVCRCGNSKSMPFCDGTHRAAGFSDEINK